MKMYHHATTDTALCVLYDRWGDAPIRTLAAAMFLPRDQLMYFDRIGYEHSVASHCPVNAEYMQKCSCDVTENFGIYP